MKKRDIAALTFIIVAIFGSSLRQAVGTGLASYELTSDGFRSVLSGLTGDFIFLGGLLMAYMYGANKWTRAAIILSAITSLGGNFYLDLVHIDTTNGWLIAVGIIAVISLDVIPTAAVLCLSEGLAKSWKRNPEVVVQTRPLPVRTLIGQAPDSPDDVIAAKAGVKVESVVKARRRLASKRPTPVMGD